MGQSIKRIVYKEIFDGDRRKFEADSNDAQTGGGARDLRFSPYREFRPLFERILNYDSTNSNILYGKFSWNENGRNVIKNANFHPPTTARNNEGRITNVNENLPSHNLPPVEDGIVFIILIHQSDDVITPEYVTLSSLENGEWHESISDPIIEAYYANRREGTATVGFVDFEYGESFHN